MGNHSFDTNVAKEIGVKSAILLQNITHWWEDNVLNGRNFREDNYWTYNSRRAYAEKFYYLTPREIQLCLEKMEKDGYILVANYNSKKYDRTLWYAITEKTYNLLRLEIKSKNLQNVYWIKQNVESIEQNVKCFQQNVEPIPNTEPYSNTNTKEEIFNSPKKESNVAGGGQNKKPAREAGGKSDVMVETLKAQFDLFRLYSKKIGMSGARKFETEYEYFTKKHKDYETVIPILLTCLQSEVADREAKKKANQFVPAFKNFLTWVNKRAWETYEKKEAQQGQEIDYFSMKYSEVQSYMKVKIDNGEWETEYAVSQWKEYEAEWKKRGLASPIVHNHNS